MDCEKALFHAHEHAQGQLTWWRSVLVSRHLADCPDCRHGYNLQIHYRQVITHKCQEQPPPDLQARIVDALNSSLPLDTDTTW
jgi:anti-sigma factor (TIGR02949 family)